MTDTGALPVRMCVVVPLDGDRWQGYCIACHWASQTKRTKKAAEAVARRHTCRKRRSVT